MSELELEEEKTVFEILNNIDVSKKTERKNGLSYLSWAWAWAEVKKLFPNTKYVVYERETEYGPVNYFTDGKTCWVKTGVIINGVEYQDMLPVMDFKNKSISLDNVTSFDVNKAVQRSITKALARHGLGLYIYAGEDLPEESKDEFMKQAYTLRAEMTSNGISHDDKKVCDWIMDKFKPTTLKIEDASIDDLKKLIQAYQFLIDGKKKRKNNKDKFDKQAQALSDEIKVAKETENKGEVDFGL